jgi:hypothetical protein
VTLKRTKEGPIRNKGPREDKCKKMVKLDREEIQERREIQR